MKRKKFFIAPWQWPRAHVLEPQGHIDIRVTLRARLVTRRVEEQPWMQTNKESIRKREVGMRCLGHASISMEVVATLQDRKTRRSPDEPERAAPGESKEAHGLRKGCRQNGFEPKMYGKQRNHLECYIFPSTDWYYVGIVPALPLSCSRFW